MRIFALTCVMLLAVAGAAGAAANKPPEPGQAMPDAKLLGIDGKEHTLSQYKGSIVVLDFMSPDCPFSKGVDQGMPQLAETYGAKGVVFLNISSNKNTDAEKLKQYAALAKLSMPMLKDEGNACADLLGATRTPEFYIIDKAGNLAYHGAYDNRKVPEKVGDVNYVKNALDDLLAGRPVKTPAVEAWGCTIKRAK